MRCIEFRAERPPTEKIIQIASRTPPGPAFGRGGGEGGRGGGRSKISPLLYEGLLSLTPPEAGHFCEMGYLIWGGWPPKKVPIESTDIQSSKKLPRVIRCPRPPPNSAPPDSGGFVQAVSVPVPVIVLHR